ncbi:MAG TPA: ribonuclease E activity regulator RraA [Ramlibacter sp.]|jgi:regulator of ribonuclease activity A
MRDIPAFNTCDLCDAHVDAFPPVLYVLAPLFQDYGSLRRFAGPVSTVRCLEDNAKVAEAVNSPGEGRVLVVDGAASLRRALCGGNLAAAASRNGWAGLVVDGAVRDVLELRASGIGIRALALQPMRPRKDDQGQRDVPVTIQGVDVRPGWWLYADEDGIVVSPRALA